MATRRRVYQLPGIQDLSKEQEAINYLPLEGNYLVVGGPGTGKSVLALIRARLLAEQRKDYLFLVYNILLEQASRQLYPKLESARWIGWFHRMYAGLFGSPPPRRSTQWQDIHWQQVEQRILDDVPAQQLPLQDKYFVIDEGQDMPPGFYQALVALGARHIFVAADQNQQITEYNARIADLRDVLDLETEQIMYLSENFRQRDRGYQVARLAREFYTDPASPPPRLPDAAHASTETPWLYAYRNVRQITERIVKRVERNPEELIGVFSYTNRTREKYLEQLLAVRDTIPSATEVPIHSYDARMKEYLYRLIRFDQGGIVVINAQSCKGLEFDTVFIADIEDFPCTADNDQAKRLFYVMTSRARERLYLLRNRRASYCPIIDDCGLLPEDPEILRRNPL